MAASRLVSYGADPRGTYSRGQLQTRTDEGSECFKVIEYEVYKIEY